MKNLEFRAHNIKRKTIQLLILGLGLLICSNSTGAPLKLKFTEGDKYSFISVTERKITNIIEQNEVTTEETIRLENDFEVQEVDEKGFAWVKYTYKRVAMKVITPEQKIDFDSDSNQPRTPIQAAPYRLAIGESLYLRLSPQGRVEKINGLQSVVTFAKAKIRGMGGAQAISAGIEQAFSELEVKHTLENQIGVFPEANNIGPVWSSTEILLSSQAGYPRLAQIEDVNIVYERMYKLAGTGADGISIVDVNMKISSMSELMDIKGGKVEGQNTNLKASLDISGQGNGQIEIEQSTGRIINSKITQDSTQKAIMVATGEMRRPPSAPKPVKTHIVMNFSMLKIDTDRPKLPNDVNK